MIRIYEDYDALSRAAAEVFADRAREAAQARGRFSVALSGGHTPRRTYQLLAQAPFRDRVPWAQVHVFWGDERCVPLDDPRSNARMAREALLDHVPVPAEQVHPIQCAQDPERAARDYEASLHGFFGDAAPRFDFVLLGLGENGHTASLFPGTEVLDIEDRWTASVYVAEQDMTRVTLTAPLINQGRAIAFLVSGDSKAQVLQQVTEGPYEPHDFPAQLIQPARGELLWLVDRAAAAKLSRAST